MTQRRGWMAVSALVLGSAAVSVSVLAQGPGGFGFGRGFGGGHVVTNEPYTATSTSTSVEKLADGVTITHSSKGTEARDAQGRTLRAMTPTPTGTTAAVTRSTVVDPVAHTITNWSSESKVASVMTVPERPEGRGDHGPGPGGPGAGGPGPGGPRGGRTHPEVKTETLPGKTVAGVYATGVKTTVTVPVGAEGNDKPLVSTREVWTASELKIVVLEISDSPRDGYHKMEVTALTPADPAAALFAVPTGYTVKEQGRHRGE